MIERLDEASIASQLRMASDLAQKGHSDIFAWSFPELIEIHYLISWRKAMARLVHVIVPSPSKESLRGIGIAQVPLKLVRSKVAQPLINFGKSGSRTNLLVSIPK